MCDRFALLLSADRVRVRLKGENVRSLCEKSVRVASRREAQIALGLG